jgi:hypothetical protein
MISRLLNPRSTRDLVGRVEKLIIVISHANFIKAQ